MHRIILGNHCGNNPLLCSENRNPILLEEVGVPTSFLGLFTYGLPSSRGGIYLRYYRLHGGCGFEFTSGGSCGRACIIPPKILGHLPPVGQRYLCLTAWGVYLRWFRLHSAGVSLCIPPVAPADVPAIPAQEFGTSTCGANINYTFFPKKCILFKWRTQNVRLMYYLCSVNTK